MFYKMFHVIFICIVTINYMGYSYTKTFLFKIYTYLSVLYYLLNLAIFRACKLSCLSHVQFYVTPMDCSPPVPSVHGILQARILERVAMPSSRGSSPPRGQTWVSSVSCVSSRFFTTTATWEAFWPPCVLVKLPQSCPTLCDHLDSSPPGSSVHGILQARILEWVAIPFSRGSCQPRDWIQVSCIAGGFFFTTRLVILIIDK